MALMAILIDILGGYMALSFKKNMFCCWEKNEITESIVGFTPVDGKYIFDFRDRLFTKICNNKELIILKRGGQPTKIDSVFMLVDKKNEEILRSFFNKKIPGSFAAIFKTKNYRSWQKEWASIMRLVRVKVETSHDFPGLMINSTIHSPEELSSKIKKVSIELGLELYENKELESINIFTNRTLG